MYLLDKEANSMKIRDVVLFLRKHNVLSKWTLSEIVAEVIRAIQQKSIAYSLDENNQLSSICIARWHTNCWLHIVAIAGERGSLKLLVKHLKEQFPTVEKLTAERRGKQVEYQVKDL